MTVNTSEDRVFHRPFLAKCVKVGINVTKPRHE